MTPRRVRVLVVMTVSAVLAAGSNLLLRHAMSSFADDAAGALAIFVMAALTPAVLVGLGGYALSQLLWLNVLTEARLGAAFPVFVGGTFVIVMAGSALFLGESLTLTRLAGALLVAAGIVVAEWSHRSPPRSARSDS